MPDHQPDQDRWLPIVKTLPRVVHAVLEAERVVAFVYATEEKAMVREAARARGVPHHALVIRIMHAWLDPYPDDPVLSDRLFAEQVRKWEEEDRLLNDDQ